jgi:hypothetical protein
MEKIHPSMRDQFPFEVESAKGGPYSLALAPGNVLTVY